MSNVCILGAGAMAEALGGALAANGDSLRLWARRSGRARALRGRILSAARGSARRVRVEADLRAALLDADLVLVCVSDRAIEEVARAAAAAWTRGGKAPVCAHTSGFVSTSALQSLAARGPAVGSLHPLVALPPPGRTSTLPSAGDDVSRGAALRGAWFRLAGAPRARTELRRIVRAVEGHELRLRRGAHPELYHAAAALLANGTVALFDAALEVLRSAGAPRQGAQAALAGLLESTLSNLARQTPKKALTGPAARGDVEVVAGHLAALGELEREREGGAELDLAGFSGLTGIYAALTRRMVELASARGTLSDEDRAAILALLDR